MTRCMIPVFLQFFYCEIFSPFPENLRIFLVHFFFLHCFLNRSRSRKEGSIKMLPSPLFCSLFPQQPNKFLAVFLTDFIFSFLRIKILRESHLRCEYAFYIRFLCPYVFPYKLHILLYLRVEQAP